MAETPDKETGWQPQELAELDGFNQLPPRQQAFVISFLNSGDFNASNAARAAGYDDTGTGAIRVRGHQLLRNPRVAAVIAAAFARHGVDASAIRLLLSALAFDADLADFQPWIDEHKTLVELRNEGVDTRMVKEAVVSDKGRRIVLHDRVAAARDLARLLGLVVDKSEVTTKSKDKEVDLTKLSEQELLAVAYATALPPVLPSLDAGKMPPTDQTPAP